MPQKAEGTLPNLATTEDVGGKLATFSSTATSIIENSDAPAPTNGNATITSATDQSESITRGRPFSIHSMADAVRRGRSFGPIEYRGALPSPNGLVSNDARSQKLDGTVARQQPASSGQPPSKGQTSTSVTFTGKILDRG